MFAHLLSERRLEAGLTVTELAQRSGTSRSAILDYEAGRKMPRIDTAERIMQAMGATLTVANLPRAPRHRALFDYSDGDELTRHRTERRWAAAEALRLLPEIVEADCHVEDIELTWGQVKALTEGISIGGEPLTIWRSTEIARSARRHIKRARSSLYPALRTVERGTLIEADDSLRPGWRQLDYLVRAVAAGGDPTLTLHLVSQALVHEGFPWLFAQYNDAEPYRQALVRVMRTGDGTDLVKILVSRLRERDQ